MPWTATTGGDATATGPDPGVIEEVEVRGHIVDSLLLPKILDRILQMGGTFEIRECRIGARRVDPSYARIAIRAGSAAGPRRDPRRPGRAWGLPGQPGGRQGRARRHRRGLPRRLLQHDQPADPGPARRPMDRRGRPGDGLRDRGRPGDEDRPMRADDRRRAGDADRGRPRRAPRGPGRAAPRGQPVRLHGLGRLQREAQGREPPGRGRLDPRHPRRRARRSCWSAARRSSTPARPRTSPS